MIEEIRGNLLEAKTEALVNAVNCVGVMGKGLALQFKKQFPAAYFKDYKLACQSGELRIGRVHVYSLDSNAAPHLIVDFPTKNHWREQSRLEDIASGLESLVEEIKARRIRSIALPALGCGLGGLNWNEVKPLIESAFSPLEDVEAIVYLAQ